ncbi:MAG: response regulator transcription factor [Dehalococcoidia bacterium]|nr:response regulator transcription factor [Dehalococcoidia bacterium]
MNIAVIERDCYTVDEIQQVLNICLPEARIIAESSFTSAETVLQQKPDLVIIGFKWNDETSFGLLIKIREISPVPVMILSYSSDVDDIVRAFNLGADGYMVKPLRLLEFAARVRGLLRRKNKPRSKQQFIHARGHASSPGQCRN